MITYDKEKLRACQGELEPLFLEQYKENEATGMYPLDPDYDRYLALEDADILHLYVVREDGKPIGHLAVIVSDHLHHKGVTYAMSDVLYLAPEYRRSMIAYNMINAAEEDLRQLGVKRLVIGMKIKQNFRKLLANLGFAPTEELWEKSI